MVTLQFTFQTVETWWHYSSLFKL